ncbi:hypothetical protein GEMRC1_006315 [Eukaryota sp. GEM-RC1]
MDGSYGYLQRTTIKTRPDFKSSELSELINIRRSQLILLDFIIVQSILPRFLSSVDSSVSIDFFKLQCSSINNLFDLKSSSTTFTNSLINQTNLSSVFESYFSNIKAVNLSISNVSTEIIFSINSSTLEFDNFIITQSKTNTNTYIYEIVNSTVIFTNSTLLVLQLDSDVYNSILLINSEITTQFLKEQLFISDLYMSNSAATFSTGFPVIIRTSAIDQVSTILGLDAFVDLSFLLSNVSLSPSSSCCNTSYCESLLYFKNVGFVEEVMVVSVSFASVFEWSFSTNFLTLHVSDLISSTSYTSSIVFSFNLPQLHFRTTLSVSMCPIEVTLLSPPTVGGSVMAHGHNFGLLDIEFQCTTTLINEQITIDHDSMFLKFEPGHGCHDLILSRISDNSSSIASFCFQKACHY